MPEETRPSVAVLIPSFRRPDDLHRCLNALADQSVLPEQVVVVARADDQDTLKVAESARGALPIVVATAERPGQVAALNAGLRHVSTDITAITDDDAAPRRDWVGRIVGHMTQPRVVGVGGRDLVIHPDVDNRPQARVGIVQWNGRIIGNHHRGEGAAREVDVLKGANMAFATKALRRRGFDERLLGTGAQVHNDLMASLAVRGAGGRLIYDPELIVDHFPAERPAGDERGVARFNVARDEAHNETLALLEFLPPIRRIVFLIWASLCGTRRHPGLLMALIALPTGARSALELAAGTAAGRRRGVAAWHRGRPDDRGSAR